MAATAASESTGPRAHSGGERQPVMAYILLTVCTEDLLARYYSRWRTPC